MHPPHRLLLLSGVGLLLSSACTGGGTDSATPQARDFPQDFLFGTAISGFQVDPGCPTVPAGRCEDRASDWYQWVTDPELIDDGGNHLSGDPLSMGPGHWELYAEDFRRASEDLGLNAQRLSLEWSRLFPEEPVGATTVEQLAAFADAEAVATYHDQLAELRARGLEPMVTLNHYTLPLWLHDGKACNEDIDSCEGAGWADPERMVEQIALYSGFCAQEFGEEVRLWATLNEPLAVVLAGYLLPSEDRTNPPGITNPEVAVEVLWAQVEAHAAMYDAVHAHDSDAAVGAVPNLVSVKPEDPQRPEDVQGAEHLDQVYNRLFLDATVHGEVDRDLDGEVEEQREDLAGRMDFIGVNYYTQVTARGLGFPLFGDYELLDFLPVGSVWVEHPEGLGEVALLADSYGVPVYITENGTFQHDDAGERFLRPHLRSLVEAMDEGADVRGYFLWSLVDNYEWNHGMGMRFGAFEVDDETKERSLRDIGATLRDVATSGRVD